MKQFVYLSILPESLVASHLPPPDFGTKDFLRRIKTEQAGKGSVRSHPWPPIP